MTNAAGGGAASGGSGSSGCVSVAAGIAYWLLPAAWAHTWRGCGLYPCPCPRPHPCSYSCLSGGGVPGGFGTAAARGLRWSAATRSDGFHEAPLGRTPPAASTGAPRRRAPEPVLLCAWLQLITFSPSASGTAHTNPSEQRCAPWAGPAVEPCGSRGKTPCCYSPTMCNPAGLPLLWHPDVVLGYGARFHISFAFRWWSCFIAEGWNFTVVLICSKWWQCKVTFIAVTKSSNTSSSRL